MLAWNQAGLEINKLIHSGGWVGVKGKEGSRMTINKTNSSKILHTKLKDNNI